MIPSGELEFKRFYADPSGRWGLYRLFVNVTTGTDVIIPHNLGFVPKQIYVVSSEGKAVSVYFKTNKGVPIKDTTKATVQFSDTNVTCTLRVE
jgi:hypothetical protein